MICRGQFCWLQLKVWWSVTTTKETDLCKSPSILKINFSLELRPVASLSSRLKLLKINLK